MLLVHSWAHLCDIGVVMQETQLTMPVGFGTLRLGMQHDWQNERKLHSTHKYMVARANLMNSYPNDKRMTCYFCGFPDGKFLELHHLDGNHDNNNSENLVLACSCCHRLHHLGWIASSNLGRMTFLPQPSNGRHPVGLLESLNLFQFYKLSQGFRHNSQQVNSLSSYPIGSVYSETRTLVGSSALGNNYANQLLFEKKKKLILKKRQELSAASEEDKENSQTQAEGRDATGAHDQAYDSEIEQKKEEIRQLEQELEDFKKEIETAATIDKLQDMSERIKRDLASDFRSYAAGSLHLLDVLETLEELRKEYKEMQQRSDSSRRQGEEEKDPIAEFVDIQNHAISAGKGFFTVEFNPSILEPWHPQLQYTLQERIKYYTEELGLSSPVGYTKPNKHDKGSQEFSGIDTIIKRMKNKISPMIKIQQDEPGAER